jgi:hypothetical protein
VVRDGFPIHVPRLYSTLLRDIGCGHQRLGRLLDKLVGAGV